MDVSLVGGNGLSGQNSAKVKGGGDNLVGAATDAHHHSVTCPLQS